MYMYIYFNRSLCLECRCVDTYVTEQKLHGCLKIALHLLCSTAHVIRYTELACIFICIYIYWSYTPTYICIDRYVCIYTLYVYVYLHCLMYLLSFYLVLFNVCTRLIHEVPFFFFFSFSVYVCLFVCVSVSYLFGFVSSVISGSRAKKLKNRFSPLSPLIFSELLLALSCFRGAQALFGFISAFFFFFFFWIPGNRMWKIRANETKLFVHVLAFRFEGAFFLRCVPSGCTWGGSIQSLCSKVEKVYDSWELTEIKKLLVIFPLFLVYLFLFKISQAFFPLPCFFNECCHFSGAPLTFAPALESRSSLTWTASLPMDHKISLFLFLPLYIDTTDYFLTANTRASLSTSLYIFSFFFCSFEYFVAI